MYQALYRKWRPKTFADVVGQEHITETLQRQVAEGRLSHAYLFTGTRGTGKTTCAKILARAVNCEHPENGNPCNRCPSCLGIESGRLLDVVELDAASNNGVDSVRALRDEAIYSPAQVKKTRVYRRRSPHAFDARVQRTAQNLGGAARASDVHSGDNGAAQGARDDFVALPAFFIPPHPAEGHRGQAQLHRGAGEYRLKGGRRGTAGPTVGRRAARRAEPS